MIESSRDCRIPTSSGGAGVVEIALKHQPVHRTARIVSLDFKPAAESIDGGATHQASSASGRYRVSATIGQWDASSARTAQSYSMTGSFWTRLARTDAVFADQFEAAPLGSLPSGDFSRPTDSR